MATYHCLLVALPVTLSIIFFYGISLTEAVNGTGFSVELIHRDSPKSPFYNPTETPFHRLTNALSRSISRVNHFYSRAKISPNTPQAEVTNAQGEFFMKYYIGTPPFEITGIVDTGSDIVWSQCKPCGNCYNQTAPMFDPSESTTYQNVICSSRVCQSLGHITCSGESNCKYTITYGDGSHSNGDLAFEALTLGSTTGSPVSFPRIPIGCGHDNAGTFMSSVSGIVGLGAGLVSLTSQIGNSIDSKFSYCLVPFFEPNTTSTLNFGENAVVSGPGTVSTPLASGAVDTFYYLTLEGMSVGAKRLDLAAKPSSIGAAEGNIIIDSGTTLTILPEEFYSKLESEVASQINLERVSGPSPVLSLCYESPPNKIEAPVITVHFTGADIELKTLNTFVSVSDDVVCFAFTSSSSGAIFGNLAQMNYLVGYDMLKKIVSFKPTDCTML